MKYFIIEQEECTAGNLADDYIVEQLGDTFDDLIERIVSEDLEGVPAALSIHDVEYVRKTRLTHSRHAQRYLVEVRPAEELEAIDQKSLSMATEQFDELVSKIPETLTASRRARSALLQSIHHMRLSNGVTQSQLDELTEAVETFLSVVPLKED